MPGASSGLRAIASSIAALRYAVAAIGYGLGAQRVGLPRTWPTRRSSAPGEISPLSAPAVSSSASFTRPSTITWKASPGRRGWKQHRPPRRQFAGAAPMASSSAQVELAQQRQVAQESGVPKESGARHRLR